MDLSSECRETSLDPADWEAMRRLGHQMVDDMLGCLREVRSGPPWRPLPPEVKHFLSQPAPAHGIGPEAAYRDFKTYVLPYPSGNIHPRFWGWVFGTGTPLGALADFLAATVNTNCWGHETAPASVEAQVISWFRAALGFPPESSGVLVTGCSMATLLGLACARSRIPGYPGPLGLTGLKRKPVLYCSTEAHNSVDKAVMLLGLGTENLRRIPVDRDYRMELPELSAAIQADLEAGHLPMAVIATAGTVNTGAIDDLHGIADLAARHGLWMHIDGAFGAMLALAPEHRNLVAGMERADSLAFDMHKWLYVPFDAGCVLVRDRSVHAAAFRSPGGYLAREARGAASGQHWFHELGIDLTRGFRALKVWLSIKEHGLNRYGRQIAQNVAQAAYLASRIAASGDLELAAPAPLNVVCFRVRPEPGEPLDPNSLNREVLVRLQERGLAVPSATTLGDRYVIRVAITNHRTRREDLDFLVDSVRALAREIRADG